MTRRRLSDAEFQQAHAAHIASRGWRDFRKEALAHFGYRCAVCRFDYRERGYSRRQLVADHKRYWKQGELIFGRETFADVRILCPACHRQGIHSDDAIHHRRRVHLRSKLLCWSLRLPLRLLRRLLAAFWAALDHM